MPSSPSLSSKPRFAPSVRIDPRLLHPNTQQSTRSNSHIRIAKTTVLGLLIVALGYGFAKILHDLFTDTSVPFEFGSGNDISEESRYITSQDGPAAGVESNPLLFHHGRDPSGWADIRDLDQRGHGVVGKDEGPSGVLSGPEINGGKAKKGSRDPALAKERPSPQAHGEDAGSHSPASSAEADIPISQPLSRSSKIDETTPRGDLWKRQRLTTSAAADIALCGTSPCRVLLPGWIGGDGVQAQHQLVQLGLLTSSLNDAYRRQARSGPFSPGIPNGNGGSLSTTIEDPTFGPYVLVLPNVSKRRMGSCFKQPFEFYYDTSPEALQEFGIERTATFEEFLGWVSTREIRPKVQIVVIERTPRNTSALLPFGSEVREVWPLTPEQGGSPAEILYDYDFPPDAPKHKYCLHENPKASRLVFHGRRPETTVYPPVISGEDNVMKAAVMEAFGFRRAGSEEASYDPVGYAPDVYVVDWESNLPVFNPSGLSTGAPETLVTDGGEQVQTQKRLGSPPRSKSNNPKKKNVADNLLPYHPAWTKLLDEAALSLSPYLAVHWPVGSVSESFLPSCTAFLIRTLIALLRKPENKDVQTVYLATDVQPFRLPLPKEGDEEPGQEDKFPALRMFLDAFDNGGLLEGYSLTGVSGLLGEVKDDDGVRVLDKIALEEIDPGVLALLDSRMAERADLFVTGTERCGGPSSFLNHIIDNRVKTGDSRNIVETFG